eukprot:TRINITY_DN8188_c0_g1_i1.p1 TRINITY_DN8188_c0_g1~~TRINITY_DN8188_c0_g1_i1.p1  ORF type:complete len:442 (+),score=91.84 TRINITY_DN8188_c0_g1_i1:34-1326(+)
MYHGALALLMCVYCCGWVSLRTAKKEDRKGDGKGSDGQFKSFQKNYLFVYALVMFSDWLKGPYVYALYDHYGFTKKDIAELFIAGFLSSMICGTYCGSISDKYGRRLMCLMFCFTYAISALTKLVPNYWVLMVGRVLAGIATSLLTTTFETWMVSEHHSRGYVASLLDNTFAWATQINGLVAVFAGVAASAVADRYGYQAPFVLAVLPLCVITLVIWSTWNENYGNRSMSPVARGYDILRNSPHLLWLGLSQSCFEAAMFTWVFLWTPAISTPETKSSLPYGVIFAAFMTCIMLGSLVFEISTHTTFAHLPYVLHGLPILTSIVPIAIPENKEIIFSSFLLFESTCGLFFPVYASLRAQHIPEESRAAISNFFRFPMNLLVVTFLFTGAQKDNTSGFTLLFFTHLAGLYCHYKFSRVSVGDAKAASSPIL